MVIVKVKRDMSGGENYLKNAIRYVHDKKGELPVSLSGNGVDPTSVTQTYHQMYAVKEYFGKTSGNPLVHIVVSYDNSVRDAQTAGAYTDQIGAYYADQYQTIQCTHQEMQGDGRSIYHCHLVANSVSYQNGKMFHSGREDMQGFLDHVQEVTGCKTRLEFEKAKRK